MKFNELLAIVEDEPVFETSLLLSGKVDPADVRKQLSRWVPMDKWDRCNAKPDLETLGGRKCFGGLDLSSKIDLAAFVLVFPPDDKEGIFDILCRFY